MSKSDKSTTDRELESKLTTLFYCVVGWKVCISSTLG